MYHECLSCHLIQELPMPSLNIVDDFYNTETDFVADDTFTGKTNDFYFSFLSPFLARRTHILDLGCGTGMFADFLHSAGHDVEAVDISRKNVESTMRYGIKAHLGFLNKIAFPEASFDVVVCMQVIEHLVDPLSEFREVNRILKHGGIFFIGTPKWDAFFPRIVKSRWKYYLPGQHVTLFNHDSINMIAEKSGFSVKSITDRLYENTGFSKYIRQFIKPFLTGKGFSTTRDGMIIVLEK